MGPNNKRDNRNGTTDAQILQVSAVILMISLLQKKTARWRNSPETTHLIETVKLRF